MLTKKRVMVGMSGGVDSSVAAAVLLEKGYDVIGVTMQISPDTGKDFQGRDDRCCSLSAIDDARRVADILGIPYYVMNFKEIFKEKVISYFINEYLEGRTPNPCIACNEHVKFNALLGKATSMGIDYIATGHYARVEYDKANKKFLLKKSVTEEKDQTYALYRLTQEQLERTLMPIGEFSKERVREIAKEKGLAVASKPDSQEICFVPDNDYARFINENSDKTIKPGDFTDKKGVILGRHKGIIHYTVGQRKGLGITFGKPIYVIGIDAKENRVILGDESEILSKTLIAGNANFISIEKPEYPMRVKAKIRYSSKEADATVFLENNGKLRVVFDNPQRAITPGQSVVLYNENTVLGGGVIESE